MAKLIVRSSKAPRILFIDVDGCLHPDTKGIPLIGPSISTPHFGWLPHLIGALRGHDDVGVVVHSTWRLEYNLAELREVLGVLGGRVVDATARGLSRYESIVGWLEEHPTCRSFRILDDQASEFPLPAPAELVLCDPSSGVSAPAVLQALKAWLDEPPAKNTRQSK